jgi:hypothetical protein
LQTLTLKTLASALYNASHGDASALSTSVSSPSDISFLEIVRQDWNYNDTTLAAICIKEMMAAEYPPLTRGASQTWTLQLACLG